MDAEGDITSRVMAPAMTVGSAAAEPDGMSGADALSLVEVVARGATEALPQRAEPRRARVERAKLRQQAAEAEMVRPSKRGRTKLRKEGLAKIGVFSLANI